MNSAFDAYHLWLGIPPEEQPPNHYRLLGLCDRESDEEVIDIAALRLSAHVRGLLNGPQSETAKRVLAEIAAASACLLDPARKAAYDATLPLPPPATREPERWPETEMAGAALPVIVPRTIDSSSAQRHGSTASRQAANGGILQSAKIIGGGLLGLALGDLAIYLVTGNDLLGVLPARTKRADGPVVVAAADNSAEPATRIERQNEEQRQSESMKPEQPATPAKAPSKADVPTPEDPGAQPTVLPISPEPDFSKIFKSPAPRSTSTRRGTALPAAPAPISPPAAALVGDQMDVLGSLVSAWRLPHSLSLDPQVVATLAREPDEPLILTLRSDAARLAAGTTFSLDAEPDGQSWTFQHVHEAVPTAKKSPLANLRRVGTDLRFAWTSLAEAETRGQLQNCLLEIRHGASTRDVQLRPVHQAGQLLLDMSDDKQIVEFALPDVPKLDKLRIEIRELAGFPEGAELPSDAKSLLMGKQAFLQFSKNSGGGIRVRFPFTSASAPTVLMRTEAVFRESARVEFDLSFPAVEKFVASIERELQKDQATLTAAQRTLSIAQSELQRQQASQPSTGAETAAKQLAMRNAKSAISSATNRIGSLSEQITLNLKRQAAVPTIRALLDSLHQRAAIRYVLLAKCGERDLLLVDGTAPVVSAD